MDVGNKVFVQFDMGSQAVLTLDERVLPDRTCGQFDSGWIAYRNPDDEGQYFVSVDGNVYPHGSGQVVGHSPTLRNADRLACLEEERFDKLYFGAEEREYDTQQTVEEADELTGRDW